MASYECRGKNKLWSVRFKIIEDGNLTIKRLSGFERKKDAEQAYRDFIIKYEESLKEIKASTSIMETPFTDAFAEYLNYKKDKVKESSYYEITNTYNLHIKPHFEGLRLKNINKTVILKWQQKFGKYSYKYKCKIRTTLFSFYKYLYYYYDVDNVVARVEPFTKPNNKKEMTIWTFEEFNRFIQNVDDIVYKTFFSFLYYTGCRLGESLALGFDDIDLNKKLLTISKTLSTKTMTKEAYQITSPKTSTSYRQIIIPDNLLEILKEYIESVPESKVEPFFFGLTKPLDDHTIYRRLEKYTSLCNNKKIRVHDLRHSHASLLISKGANILLVAKRLGHKNTQQTLNTYAHLFPNSELELINLINEIELISA